MNRAVREQSVRAAAKGLHSQVSFGLYYSDFLRPSEFGLRVSFGIRHSFVIWHSSFVIPSSFVICACISFRCPPIGFDANAPSQPLLFRLRRVQPDGAKAPFPNGWLRRARPVGPARRARRFQTDAAWRL